MPRARYGFVEHPFLAEYEWERFALSLAHDNNDATLAGVFFCGAAINALRSLVSRLDGS